MTLTINKEWEVDGVLTDVTSAKLLDPTGTYGVKRDDTGEAVVAAGTDMERVAAGQYRYTFEEPEPGLSYTAFIQIVFEGSVYYFDVDKEASSAADDLPFNRIRLAVADFLGWGRNSEGTGADWPYEDIRRLADILKSGVSQVYYPALVASNGEAVHRWSWMRPTLPLVTAKPYSTGTVEVSEGIVTLTGGEWPEWAAQGDLVVRGGAYPVASRDSGTQLTLLDTTAVAPAGEAYSLSRYLYDLPADFASLEGGLTFQPDRSYQRSGISLVSDNALRQRRQFHTHTGLPEVVAIRPKRFASGVGQQWQAALHPTPDQVYNLQGRYRVQPPDLTSADPRLMGGPEIEELVLQSCLAVAEQRYRGESGLQTEVFLAKLRAAIATDAAVSTPDTLGYNADRSDLPSGIERFRGEAIHSYEGVYYFDRNP